MTLDLKYIASVNLNYKPFFSSQFEKDRWKNDIDTALPKSLNENENELTILFLQGLYGYRSGVIGYLANLLSVTCGKYFNTYLLKFIINSVFQTKFNCNDLELLTGIISIINRQILFLNY